MSELERYLDAWGERMRTAPAPARPHRSLMIVATTTVAAAAIVVAVVLATGGRMDAVAQARAALAPPGEILHMVVRVGKGNPTEQWSAVSPLRWRLVQHLPSRGQSRRPMTLDADGPIYGRMEMAYANGSQRTFLAERNTLHVQHGFTVATAPPAPSLFGDTGADPQSDLRAMLASGRITDSGTVQVGTRTVRRLVGEESDHRFTRRLVYDVDPDTFAPVQGSITITAGAAAPSVLRFTVERYERIPLTAQSAKLLTIRTNPRTKETVRLEKP